MNKKQKIVWTLLLAIVTLLGFSYADWLANVLPIEDINEQNTCTNTSKIYLDKDQDGDTFWDFGLYLNSNFIVEGTAHDYTAGKILMENNNTKVKYFAPLQNMIYKIATWGSVWPLDEYTFYRASFVFPYNTPVRGIATTPNKVVFEQPSDNDPEKKTIGFIYSYNYVYAINRWNGTYGYRYNQVPNMNYMLNIGLNYITTMPGDEGNRLRIWNNKPINQQVCINYELSRCGDGTIDSNNTWTYINQFTGELCDDWPLNGTPGKCPLGCWSASGIPRCWDNTLQPEWTQPYDENGDGVIDANEMSFEFCDDGDLIGDNGDGVLNGDDPEANQCATNCQQPFYEIFDEVFDDI